MNSKTKEFFQRVKRWVRENSMTIDGLMQEALGATEDVYSSWKRSKKLPSATYIGKLAQKMCVTTDWLIFGKEADSVTNAVEDADSATDTVEKELLERFRALDNFDKRTVMDLSRSLGGRHISATAQKMA